MSETTTLPDPSTGPSTTPPPPSVWPTLRAHDARALIRFLVDVFGFREVVAWGDQPDGSGDIVVHAQLAWPSGGGVMLGSVRPAQQVDSWPQQPGGAGVYVVCDDPDEIHARAAAAGATVLRAPQDTDYGAREFTVRDPEGNLWSFGTYRGEPQ
jgi:uncharacterized glyoxalase superfamily protein PhnB